MSKPEQAAPTIQDALAGKGSDRLVYEYSVPASVERNPFRKVGIIELSTSEHIMVSKTLPGDASAEEMQLEITKACIWTIDGLRVNRISAQFELMWERVHPKVRTMLKKAATLINMPTPKEDEDFFQSRVIRTNE